MTFLLWKYWEETKPLDKVYFKEVWVWRPTPTRGVRKTLHVPREKDPCKPVLIILQFLGQSPLG